MSIFSEKVSLLLFQKKLSQKELAIKAEVTESAMSYYVKGEVLSRIAKALNCSTDYLLGNTAEISIENDSEQLQYLQRNLSKLDPEALKKAENMLKIMFDDIFEDDGE